MDNPNPQVKVVSKDRKPSNTKRTYQERIYDIVRDIRDPEHPHSLEELSVLDIDSVSVLQAPDDSPGYGKVSISFTPTVPHCSLASIIGLSIQAKLRQSQILNPRGDLYYKLSVTCAPGSHASADDINKQLADKERVSAAFENPKINALLSQCIENLPM